MDQDAILYGMLYLYTVGNIFLTSCWPAHDSSPVLSFSYTVCLSLFFFFLSGEGLELKKKQHNFLFPLFIFKCTHFFGRFKERKHFDYFLSVFLYKYIWKKKRKSTIGVCSLQIQLYWIS